MLEVLTTVWNDEGGWRWSDVGYLDRHPVVCRGGALLTQFQLETRPTPGVFNSRQIRYSYTCDSSLSLMGESKEEWSNGLLNPITFMDLDGLKLACLQGYALQGVLGLIRNRVQDGWDARYTGGCLNVGASLICSERATPWAPGGRGELRNLEKHDVRCEPRGCLPSCAQAERAACDVPALIGGQSAGRRPTLQCVDRVRAGTWMGDHALLLSRLDRCLLCNARYKCMLENTAGQHSCCRYV